MHPLSKKSAAKAFSAAEGSGLVPPIHVAKRLGAVTPIRQC